MHHLIFSVVSLLFLIFPGVSSFSCNTYRKTAKTELNGKTRRDIFSIAGVGLTSSVFSYPLSAHATSVEPLADLPMIRLKLPKNAGVGRDYVVIQLNIDGKGPYKFMIDSGLTTEMITPHLKDILNIHGDNVVIRGHGAGGGEDNPLVELKGASLCCGKFRENKTSMPLPPLHAIVTDFPQEHIDPRHDVEGMIGVEFLELFDVEFDFPNERVRLWPPQKSPKNGLVAIPAVIMNESGLEGIRIRSPQQAIAQPMLGIIDCGSSMSIANLPAAKLLGLPLDPKEYKSPTVMGIGVDGKPLLMPTATVQFSFAGNAYQGSSPNDLRFEDPPSKFKPWDKVSLAIGDLPVFRDLLGDGKSEYTMPTVLVGLDILAQRRIILESGKGRARRIFVAPQ